jgi:hypothetical protein
MPDNNPWSQLLKPITDALNATTIRTDSVIKIDDKSQKFIKMAIGTLSIALILSAIIKARK